MTIIQPGKQCSHKTIVYADYGGKGAQEGQGPRAHKSHPTALAETVPVVGAYQMSATAGRRERGRS